MGRFEPHASWKHSLSSHRASKGESYFHKCGILCKSHGATMFGSKVSSATEPLQNCKVSHGEWLALRWETLFAPKMLLSTDKWPLSFTESNMMQHISQHLSTYFTFTYSNFFRLHLRPKGEKAGWREWIGHNHGRFDQPCTGECLLESTNTSFGKVFSLVISAFYRLCRWLAQTSRGRTANSQTSTRISLSPISLGHLVQTSYSQGFSDSDITCILCFICSWK